MSARITREEQAMAIIVESKGGKFEKCPEGVHFAVCVGIWDLGTQPSELYEPTRQVMFSWEIVGDESPSGEPYFVSQSFTMSLHEKSKLRPKLEAWRGKPFTEQEAKRYDLTERLGKPCQIQVVHADGRNGKSYANVTTLMQLPKGVPPIQAKSALTQYSITDGENFPEGMPDFVKDRIRKSHQFADAKGVEARKDEAYAAFSGGSPPARSSGPLPWEDASPAY